MARRRRASENQAIVGVVLLVLGVWFLAGLPGTAEIGTPIGQFLAQFWPIVLVVVGLVLLAQTYGVLRR